MLVLARADVGRYSPGVPSRRVAAALLAVAGCSSGALVEEPDGAAAIPEIAREKSLVWTDPAIVDDLSAVGLARVMAAVAGDGHGGAHLAAWFRAFSTTAHSERLGPALLIEELEAELGSPEGWDLDALPFLVTAVHNRIDLGPRQGACGELRVSFASTHPVHAPFHAIFLFRQDPGPGDADAGGDVHCRATARRWAELTGMGQADFLAAARSLLDDNLQPGRFLLTETVELTVSPWEWRQWIGLENPLLFQTVDTPRLNQPGPLRDAFLAFARDNAELLAARALEIPAAFRAPSARVPPGVARERLELAIDGHPDLAGQIEIVGCPACHTDDADFVQTTPQRTFSSFYERELDARAEWLGRLAAGQDPGVPAFGPLQSAR